MYKQPAQKLPRMPGFSGDYGMFRFIVLTFVFMGWAFFEMSGGTDFDGEALRMSRIEVDQTTPTAPRTLLADVDTQRSYGEAEVTRVALNLATTSDIATPAKPMTNAATPVKYEGATLSSASMNVSEGPEIILPSLIPSAQPEIQRETQVSAELMVQEDNGVQDVRAVTGNRVNVRGGPGTDYGVVGSLTRGVQVEILQDPGNGWVKLRPMDGGTEGWMADFLLTSS